VTGRRFGLSTAAVHGVPQRRADWAPVVAPIVQSSTFVLPVGSSDEILYLGNNNTPSQTGVARKYAALEGTEAAIVLASGMAATALAHLAVLRPGDHLLSSRWIYGGTQRLFDEEFGRLGIAVTYVNPEEPRQWRKSLRRETRAVFVESPTNPLMRVVDLRPIRQVAQSEGLAVLVDSTFASPINWRPVEHGADVVITSATKYLNGHNDVLAGAVAASAPIVEELARLVELWGAAVDPHCAWLMDRGLRTLAVRMQRQNENGLAVAQWAERQPWIEKVWYPGLPSHPDHAVARESLAGFGGMVGLLLRGGALGAERFLGRLKLVTHAPSLGGVESLASEPRNTSHRKLTPEGRAALGFPDGFIRLSCGIEDADDIIGDLEQAGRQ
jgi:cystathionine beta-lyase/cystathionine gamma-synthase